MPKALPLIEKTDRRLQQVSRGRVSILDIAGLPNMMLSVPGRKTGVPRTTPLLCVPHHGEWLVAGSYFGDEKMPVWVHNLRASDGASIVFEREKIDVKWREVQGPERETLWKVLVSVWPNFDLYKTRTKRVIPVFVLSRTTP